MAHDDEKKRLLEDDEGNAESHIKIPKRTIIIEPVLILYALSMPTSMINKQFMYSKIGSAYNYTYLGNGSACDNVNNSGTAYLIEQRVQEETSQWEMYLNLASTIPALLSSLFIGALSDKVGRKPTLLFAVFAGLLKHINYTIVIYFNLDIPWLFVGNLVQGLSGGFILVIANTFSYISDVIEKKNRSFRITVLASCLGIAAAAAISVSGYMIEGLGFTWPYVIISGIDIINLLYIHFGVPETVTAKKGVKIISCDHMKNTLVPYLVKTKDGRQWKLLLLLSVLVLHVFSYSDTDVFTLKVMKSPICFDPVILGYFFSIDVLAGEIFNVIIVKLFQNRVPDSVLALVGCISCLAKFIYIPFTNNKLMVFFVPVISIASGLVILMCRSNMSKIIHPNEMGAVFAGIACAENLAEVLGSSSFNAIYSATLHIFDGIVFIVMAIISLIALILNVVYIVALKLEARRIEKTPVSIN